jgi:Ca-activated chloride channel family protein
MSFTWPAALLALAIVPLLVALHVGVERRRATRAAALAAAGLVVTHTGAGIGRRRHLAFAVTTLAVSVLLVGVARPRSSVAVPHRTGTVVLAFDVSNSMRADDLQPTRLDAAKAAARAFVEDQPSDIEIGVVAFGDGALVSQRPTSVQADVLAAIDRLEPLGGTAIGPGIFQALNAVSPNPIDLTDQDLSGPLDDVDIGYLGWSTIVLLSDGENTRGPDPLALAGLAANAGVHVTTIGIGSPQGAVIDIDGYQVATTLDEGLLQQIATTTGGTYHRAEDAASLAEVYRSIDLRLTTKGEEHEITDLFSVTGLGLLLAGAALTVRWTGRVV